MKFFPEIGFVTSLKTFFKNLKKIVFKSLTKKV